MDITFELDITFNYRVAGIIKNNDKILISINDTKSYFSLPGGRVNTNEDSISAIKREIKEETGYETKHLKYLGLIENFYVSRYGNKPSHEILIVHELEFLDQDVYNLEEIINLDEEDNARFIWVLKDKLDDLKPDILKKILNEENFHYINRDY